MNEAWGGVEPTVRRVPIEERAAAISRVAMGGVRPTAGAAERFVASAAADGMSLEHIWAWACDGDALAEGAMILPQPGRTGMLFVSHPTRGERVSGLAATVNRACAGLDRRDVTLVQGLLELTEHRERAALSEAGFEMLAALTYMQCRVPRHAPEPTWEGDAVEIQCESWDPSRADDFAAALTASYEQTLDCPAMRGLREPRDVLAGHRAAGKFEPDWWTLMRVNGEPAALMLLAPIEGTGDVELVYLGVSPRWRRKGLSRYLIRRGMHRCAAHGLRTMTLAVDEGNGPALRLYQAMGFGATTRRLGMMRVLEG